MKAGVKPTGTPFAAALSQAGATPALALTEDVPCPGPRFGKREVYRATLLAMHGDMSFLVPDATQIYVVAKDLGIRITTRKVPGGVRVWRIA